MMEQIPGMEYWTLILLLQFTYEVYRFPLILPEIKMLIKL